MVIVRYSMADQTLIEQLLPESLWEIAKRFRIPAQFLQEKTELVVMILQSRSMDTDKDKQDWFNLMPVMSAEQIEKLNGILTREKEKLAEIEKKYEEKKVAIKKKYLMRWQNMGYIKKINDLQEKESQAREQEEQEADSLLDNL